MKLTTAEAAYDYMSQDGRCPGELISVTEQNGGFTSYTYRVESSEGTFFLKHAADHKKGAPHLASDPTSLFDEAHAYDIVSKYVLPRILPRPVFVDRARHTLLLTDALPGATTTLKDIVHEPRWPLVLATEVGYHLGHLHGSAAVDQPTVRSGVREEEFYHGLVAWLTSDLSFNSPATQELIEAKAQYSACQPKTLIMGDLAPRNIIANETEIALVDWARATRGSPSFDVGYFVGHLLLNAIEFEELSRANHFLERFRGGYEAGLAEGGPHPVLPPDAIFGNSKIFAAGWMHRRTFQPYQSEDIPAHELRTVESYIGRLAADESFGY